MPSATAELKPEESIRFVTIPNAGGAENKAIEILNSHGKDGMEIISVDELKKANGLMTIQTKVVMQKSQDYDGSEIEYNVLRTQDIFKNSKDSLARLQNLYADGWRIVAYIPCIPHRTIGTFYMCRYPNKYTPATMYEKIRSVEGKASQAIHQARKTRDGLAEQAEAMQAQIEDLTYQLHQLKTALGVQDGGQQEINPGLSEEVQPDVVQQASPDEATEVE